MCFSTRLYQSKLLLFWFYWFLYLLTMAPIVSFLLLEMLSKNSRIFWRLKVVCLEFLIIGLFWDKKEKQICVFALRFLGKEICFLREVSLIKSNIVCQSCNVYMKCCKKSNVLGGFSWACRNKILENGKKKKQCGTELSFRYSSWFNASNLTLEEVFFC